MDKDVMKRLHAGGFYSCAAKSLDADGAVTCIAAKLTPEQREDPARGTDEPLD
jgi:hypothetical protein